MSDRIPAGMKTPYPVFTVEELRSDLAIRAHRIREMLGSICDGVDYCCTEEFIADRGIAFERFTYLPDECAPMKMGRCFANAYNLSQWSGGHLSYCEGFAGHCGQHHAWCCDWQGRVVDPTWVVRKNDKCTHQGPYLGYKFTDLMDAHDLLQSTSKVKDFSRIVSVFPGVGTIAMAHVFTAKRGDATMFESFGPWLTGDWIDKLFDARRAKRKAVSEEADYSI